MSFFGLVGLLAAGLAFQSPDGRRTVSAVEAHAPIVLDGALDEEVWRAAEPAGEFVQAEPHEGEPATELTEVRLAFDRDAIYIGVVCHDTDPAGAIINDIRKDFVAGEQDSFEVILDTFADRRNGFVFVTNAAGAKSDTQIANEGRDVNTSWDAVWTVATRRDAGGWSAEIRIPFKTLRFQRGADRVWGVNFSRRIRRKNEIDYWSRVPRVYNLYRAGFGGTLTGLPDASEGRNLRIKPWIAADSTRPVAGAAFDAGAHAGLDLKYGVTPSLTLDVTAKPDFAQAEADEQQVNLTQFSLYYPEKREFFLENSGTFYFGDIPRESRLGNNRFSPPEEEMLLFFSRRIGLTGGGQPIPIDAGARLTGRAGAYGVGLMTIQTDPDGSAPGDNYTVLRGRRDVLGTSDVGAIFLSRQSTASGDYNRVYGADANFRFFRALSLNGFLAKSETPGVVGGELSGKGSIVWNDNFVHTQYSLLSVGDNFRDDIGFVKRTGIRKHFADFGVRPRPAGAAQVRHPRAAPAHALQHLHRSVEREGDAHQPRRDERLLRERRQRRVRSEPAVRADRGARLPCRPDQSFAVGQVRMDGIQPAGRDEPQPHGVGVARSHHGRVLVGNAAVNQARRDRQAVVPSAVRPGAAAQRHRPAVPDACLRDQPGDLPHRLCVQHADVPGYAAAIQHRPEAAERQRPLRSHPPSAQRSVRGLQRAAADGSAHASRTRGAD